MSTKRKTRAAAPLTSFDDEPAAARERRCEWQGCGEVGEFRAPRSREELSAYRWYCLGHVREYNKSWNYYDGMSDGEVEEDVRHDTVWNRPTWQIGTKLGPGAFDNAEDPFNLFTEGRPGGNGASSGENAGQGSKESPVRPPISVEEERAYQTLDLEYPVSASEVKTRYKSLVKEHHPDANKGAKSSEERLKQINEAYSVLRASLSA